ncbi:PITH domain-containing protein 1 isoform X3 [Amborella trichopoda]|uniref:PITH domain-containing protein 1 isoform X3 n=1 Tax=Amborella trichopoda TaxID=13333 RepID=UPI0009BFB70D|nr:PITH domain-containing protein 1 isoform X3 [Amborella trichopoda]|eukprot:XP_020528852.1 PITH domain-containing protein 1 isoform X3 [Amborella trichopoda]
MACLHDHSCEDHDCGSQWSLYKHIDIPKVSALNEATAGSVKSIFKAWELRLDTSKIDAVNMCFSDKFSFDINGNTVLGFLESNEGDPELLIFIPFINRDNIDFSDAQDMTPLQEWELAENLQGMLEYQTRYSRFQSVGSLTLHFPDNFGGDSTQIYYIGLRGEATQLKRDVVATIVYEVMPNPSDHKTPTDHGGGMSEV